MTMFSNLSGTCVGLQHLLYRQVSSSNYPHIRGVVRAAWVSADDVFLLVETDNGRMVNILATDAILERSVPQSKPHGVAGDLLLTDGLTDEEIRIFNSGQSDYFIQTIKAIRCRVGDLTEAKAIADRYREIHGHPAVNS